MKRTVLWAAVLLCAAGLNNLRAENAVESSTSLNLQASTRPEARLSLIQGFTFPILRGENPLFAGNNIAASATAEISPVSVNAVGRVSLTPVAFLQVNAGGRAGSGWNMPLGTGIGINRRTGQHDAETDGSAFNGLLWAAWAGTTLQFDLAAVIPGDWNHVVAMAYNEINYRGYSAAEKDEAWYFENDEGENMNGFTFYGSYVLGYQMPIFFNMAAFMAELHMSFYDTPGRDLWGDDLPRWVFSGLFNFKIIENLEAALIVQFRTMRNFTSETEDYEFYQDRRMVNSGSKYHLEFYRVALNVTYKIR
ncbi:hypothetical protein [Breznakiella homolactica]|uniref:Uncharacterized protein n=1 Tax=Breznakiella homolactica TaxID=2798577 RepID=A0A7T7XP97_9SPIR|nr:hypothetical protein [Breznakiella homolactica]QQO09986.1 hypothetical protein JFL75_03470 [Breznakiella homolactica]